MFDCIEIFYNPTRKHARNGTLSPIEFEREHNAQADGVSKARGGSSRGPDETNLPMSAHPPIPCEFGG